jgi:hypothetical protein
VEQKRDDQAAENRSPLLAGAIDQRIIVRDEIALFLRGYRPAFATGRAREDQPARSLTKALKECALGIGIKVEQHLGPRKALLRSL